MFLFHFREFSGGMQVLLKLTNFILKIFLKSIIPRPDVTFSGVKIVTPETLTPEILTPDNLTPENFTPETVTPGNLTHGKKNAPPPQKKNYIKTLKSKYVIMNCKGEIFLTREGINLMDIPWYISVIMEWRTNFPVLKIKIKTKCFFNFDVLICCVRWNFARVR